MKKIKLIVLGLIWMCGCVNGQPLQQHHTAFQFIVDNFKTGNYKAELMTGSKNNARRIELTNKMRDAIKDNFAWYVEFVKATPNGLPTQYDKRLGLTEEEFRELRQIIDNYRISSELDFNLSISCTDSILKFNSEYNKELLAYFKIDLKDKTIHLGEREFLLTDTIGFSDSNNRMGSQWYGYRWTYQVPDKIDFSNLAELVDKDAILYRINFGILQPSQKLFFSVKGVEIEKGEQKMSFSIPLLLTEKK